MMTAGRLEEALEQYKRSKEFGSERADPHIRNVGPRPFTLNKRMIQSFALGQCKNTRSAKEKRG